MYSNLQTDNRQVDMAKSSLLMRADPSGGGSRRLLIVALSSLSSAQWTNKVIAGLNPTIFCVALKTFLFSFLERDDDITGVTVSFFRAELYCSSERRGSPLGKVRRGDLVAISHTPSYHSSGQSPENDMQLLQMYLFEQYFIHFINTQHSLLVTGFCSGYRLVVLKTGFLPLKFQLFEASTL